MEPTEKEIENCLRDLGMRLASPPSNVDELLHILDLAEIYLSRVEQSPSASMSDSLCSLMNSLVTKEFLNHKESDVKVFVAACIHEIIRITAPDSPYNDDLMKEIFAMIVDGFEKLDNISGCSYFKMVSILEVMAKVRSCVVMLDLECNDLILLMFTHFLKSIRPDHPINVISSMEMIMTLIVEESEDISHELLICLLSNVQKSKKGVMPVACRLVEKIISNCAMKLKPYILVAVQSMGITLNDYSDIVASICQESSITFEQNEESEKLNKLVGCLEAAGNLTNKPTTEPSNGVVPFGIENSIANPNASKLNPENYSTEQSRNVTVARGENNSLVSILERFSNEPNSLYTEAKSSSSQFADASDFSRGVYDKEPFSSTIAIAVPKRQTRVLKFDAIPETEEILGPQRAAEFRPLDRLIDVDKSANSADNGHAKTDRVPNSVFSDWKIPSFKTKRSPKKKRMTRITTAEKKVSLGIISEFRNDKPVCILDGKPLQVSDKKSVEDITGKTSREEQKEVDSVVAHECTFEKQLKPNASTEPFSKVALEKLEVRSKKKRRRRDSEKLDKPVGCLEVAGNLTGNKPTMDPSNGNGNPTVTPNAPKFKSENSSSKHCKNDTVTRGEYNILGSIIKSQGNALNLQFVEAKSYSIPLTEASDISRVDGNKEPSSTITKAVRKRRTHVLKPDTRKPDTTPKTEVILEPKRETELRPLDRLIDEDKRVNSTDNGLTLISQVADSLVGEKKSKSYKTKHSSGKKRMSGITPVEKKSLQDSDKKSVEDIASANGKTLKAKSDIIWPMGEDATQRDVFAEPCLKEMSSTFEGNNDENGLLLGVKSRKKSRRRSHGLYHIYLEIIGRKIEVWWPDDQMFYKGVIDGFDPETEKHRIVYDDGDVENLFLRDERWNYVDDSKEFEMEQEIGENPKSYLQIPKKKATSYSGKDQPNQRRHKFKPIQIQKLGSGKSSEIFTSPAETTTESLGREMAMAEHPSHLNNVDKPPEVNTPSKPISSDTMKYGRKSKKNAEFNKKLKFDFTPQTTIGLDDDEFTRSKFDKKSSFQPLKPVSDGQRRKAPKKIKIKCSKNHNAFDFRAPGSAGVESVGTMKQEVVGMDEKIDKKFTIEFGEKIGTILPLKALEGVKGEDDDGLDVIKRDNMGVR